MTTITPNPHKWLFAHLKLAQGYESTEEARKALVFDYSDGKTDSLSELFDKYPSKYQKMRRDLGTNRKTVVNPLDHARKRLIAAIFGNLEQRGYKGNMEYVKSIACIGAKEKRFNDIPLDTLKALYNRFKNKNLNNEIDSLINSVNK